MFLFTLSVVVCLFIAVIVLGTLYDIVFIQRPKWETEDQMASSEYEVKYSKKGEKASLLDNADSKIVHEPGNEKVYYTLNKKLLH